MGISQSDWTGKWDRVWDVTVCDPYCGMDESTDDIQLEATWNLDGTVNSVTVKQFRNKKEHKTLTTDLTPDGDTKLTKTTPGQTITITWQDETANTKAKLICTVEEPLTALPSITIPNAATLFEQIIVWTARAAMRVGEGVYRFGFGLLQLVEEETDTGGQPGSWTAEDGGNRNAPRIAPPDTLIYARARRA
jgi:hypothetical protein